MKMGQKCWGAWLAAATIALALPWVNAQRATEQFTLELFWSTECPHAARQSAELARLLDELSELAPVSTVMRFPNAGDDRHKVRTYLRERNLNIPFEIDYAGERARAAGVTKVPTAILRNAAGEILYRGALFDLPAGAEVTGDYIQTALREFLLTGEVTRPEVEPYGCLVMPAASLGSDGEITYADHIAHILNQHCVACHRPDQAAPFRLDTYEDASRWAAMVAYSTQNGTMPPWKAVPGFGQFRDANVLTERQIAMLQAWADAGAPSGDLSQAPVAPTFAEGWALGEPDRILQLDAPFEIPAGGRDEYWHFVFDPQISEPTYVKAFDVEPDNRRILHHVIAFIDRSGQAEQLVQSRGNGIGYENAGGIGFIPSGAVGGWAPGLQPVALEQGSGILLEPGDRIVLQMHYTKTGRPELDQSRVALYFAQEEITEPIQIHFMANPLIRIVPGEKDQKFTSRMTLPADVRVHGSMPHMHLLGRSMRAWAELPDGTIEPIVYVRDWDFDWQMQYVFEEPLELPRGTVIHLEAVFDNSSDNPRNPSNPPRLVRWGEETTDEMMLLVFWFGRK